MKPPADNTWGIAQSRSRNWKYLFCQILHRYTPAQPPFQQFLGFRDNVPDIEAATEDEHKGIDPAGYASTHLPRERFLPQEIRQPKANARIAIQAIRQIVVGERYGDLAGEDGKIIPFTFPSVIVHADIITQGRSQLNGGAGRLASGKTTR